jgi:hypothetical protein
LTWKSIWKPSVSRSKAAARRTSLTKKIGVADLTVTSGVACVLSED